jgi:hypothetical protein
LHNSIQAAPSGVSPFDSIRHLDDRHVEFWYGRELMPTLGYEKWQRFGTKESDQVSVICRAIISCSNSGGVIDDNFVHLPKQVISTQYGLEPTVEDWKLSRQACYLVAMNGDVTKPEIAAAQSYFAFKTREAEATTEGSSQILNEILKTVQSLDRRLSGVESTANPRPSRDELPQSILNIIDRRDKKQQAYANLLEIRDQWCKAKDIKDSAMGDYSFCAAVKNGEVAEVLPLLDLVKFGTFTGVSRSTICRARKRMKDTESYRNR